jgi:hypothetical protein
MICSLPASRIAQTGRLFAVRLGPEPSHAMQLTTGTVGLLVIGRCPRQANQRRLDRRGDSTVKFLGIVLATVLLPSAASAVVVSPVRRGHPVGS